MSTVPPNMPPQGPPPGQPYQQYGQPPYGQQPYGQPYPPPPGPKKTSPIVWILLVVGGLFLLGILAVAGAGYFFLHKVKQAGVDTELMKRNPGLATVKMMAAMNPNIDVVSVDDDKGVISVREKSTGKVFTVDFEDAKKGRFVVKQDGKDAVTISSSGSDGKDGTVEVKSADGSFKVGGGAGAKVPAWVPDYPGSNPQGVFSAQSNDGASGSYAFKTNDSVDQVIKFYEDGFKSGGMKTTSTLSNSDGKRAGGMLSAELEKKSAMVMFGTENGQTTVSVTFQAKK